MDKLTNQFIRILILMPIFFSSWCGFAYYVFGYIPDGNIRAAIIVTGLCTASLGFLFWIKRRAKRSPVFLHIRPNVIEVVGAEVFQGSYSSQTHFVVSLEEFKKTLARVVCRPSYTRGRFMFARESAFVRIWPGALDLTQLELDALANELCAEFIDVDIEVAGTGNDDVAQATAFHA